jgi:hypothetical protein
MMNTDHPIPDLVALLDRLDEHVNSPELLRQIQAELEVWISRHCSESQRNA